MKNVQAPGVIALLLLGLAATDTRPDVPAGAGSDSLASLFADAGVIGTFVVADDDGDILHVYNAGRANERLSPASTFKIPHTLIALDRGVVDGPESAFEWDGTERAIQAWNEDQTLASAFRVSCVWCYQSIARDIGRDAYPGILAAIDYGNGNIGERVDQFWLDGSLRISAMEQVTFLVRFLERRLPFEDRHQAMVENIMRVGDRAGFTLYGKSGWTGPELHTGWYVGFVVVGENRFAYALNIDMHAAEQAPLRQSLAIDALKRLAIVPAITE